MHHAFHFSTSSGISLLHTKTVELHTFSVRKQIKLQQLLKNTCSTVSSGRQALLSSFFTVLLLVFLDGLVVLFPRLVGYVLVHTQIVFDVVSFLFTCIFHTLTAIQSSPFSIFIIQFYFLSCSGKWFIFSSIRSGRRFKGVLSGYQRWIPDINEFDDNTHWGREKDSGRKWAYEIECA